MVTLDTGGTSCTTTSGNSFTFPSILLSGIDYKYLQFNMCKETHILSVTSRSTTIYGYHDTIMYNLRHTIRMARCPLALLVENYWNGNTTR